MRVVLPLAPARRILQWMQGAFLTCAVLMLGYCAFALLDTWAFQRHEQHEFDRQLTGLKHPFTSPQVLPPAAAGGPIGRIEIARLGISVMVVEGTGDKDLRRAAGHITGTALPGQTGNIGISAHRDTFFRPLRNIRKKDIITITTLLGKYDYRVISTKIVLPSNVEVLLPTGHEVLTLVTCYPFYFIGPAPDRFIVRAERIGERL